MAFNNLGTVLAGQGDMQGALDAYQRAGESSSPEQAALAMNSTGFLLLRLRDVEGARAAFQRALNFDVAEQTTIAREQLSRLEG